MLGFRFLCAMAAKVVTLSDPPNGRLERAKCPVSAKLRPETPPRVRLLIRARESFFSFVSIVASRRDRARSFPRLGGTR